MVDAHVENLQKLVGDGNVIATAQEKLAADKPWREAEASDNFIAVVDFTLPEELRRILHYCVANDIAIVPRAGGTSLSNGASISTYRQGSNYILLRDARPPTFEIDENGVAKISGNVTAKMLEQAQPDWIVPVDLGIGSKEGLATIFGYIATNAAGSGAAFKGRAADMLRALRVIYADGQIADVQDFADVVGMGGTTAIILEAEIQLIKRPQQRTVAALRVENISQMYDILQAAKQQCWAQMNLFERVNPRLFDIVADALSRNDAPATKQLRAAGNGDYLFIEVNAGKQVLERLLQGYAAIITDEQTQADFLLSYRVVNASTKGSEFAKKSGGKMVAFDISVPAGDAAEFPSNELIAEIEQKFSGVEILYFGHAAGVEKIGADSARGGTALHFNPILPAALATPENENMLRRMVYAHVAQRGGMIVSEHGIGTKFVAAFKEFHPQKYAEFCTKIARLSPQNILNRGVNCEHEDVQKAVRMRDGIVK